MYNHKPFLLAFILFLIALAVRLPNLDTFLTADEFLWVDRSRDFLGGLLSQDYPCLLPDDNKTNVIPAQGLACTLRTGHPGVLTMWTGAAGITLNWLTTPPTETRSLMQFIKELPTNPIEQSIIAPVRLLTVIITALFVAMLYGLLRKLFNPNIALLAALLVALNPFHIALSRVLHHDALSTTFIVTASLSLIIYFGVESKRRWLILAGILSGIAMLSKSTGFFIIAYAGLLALWALFARWGRGEAKFIPAFFHTVRDGLLWAVTVIITFFLLWPAMWVIPAWALSTVFNVGFRYASGGHAKGVLFFNTILPDPGPLFYPVMWLFRTNFWAMLGFFLALVLGFLALRHRKSKHSTILSAWLDRLSPRGFNDKTGLLIWIGAFLFFFLLAMTLGEKKQDRYLLPFYPMADIVAAVALWHVVKKRQLLYQRILVALVIAVNLFFVIWHAPYYFTYYNPLVGGIQAAAKNVTIGWGEGLNLAAATLNKKPNAEKLKVSAWYGSTFAPYFNGQTIRFADEKGNVLAGDYVIFYINQLQRHYPDDEIWFYMNENQELVETISLAGLDYAWIYTAPAISHYVEDQAYKGIAGLLGWVWHGNITPDDSPLSPGSSYPFSLFWEYFGKLPEETFFMRLIGPDGNIWAESNSQPTPQFSNSSTWRMGQIIEESGQFTIPAHTPPGNYTLQIGFYTQAPAITQGELTFPVPTAPLDKPLQTITIAPPSPTTLPIGYNLLDLRLLSQPTITLAENLSFNLIWATQQQTKHTYQAAFALIDENGHPRWHWPAQPLISFFPTSTWPASVPLRSQWHLPFTDPRIPSGTYQLQLQLIDETGQTAKLELDTLQIPGRPRHFNQPQPQNPISATLEQSIAFLGFDSNLEILNSNQPLNITLYWQGLTPIEKDYTIFLQLIGPDGQVYAQHDSQPLVGQAPTSTWTPTEMLTDPYTLNLPPDLPTGKYQLITGMYHLETGERLTVNQNQKTTNFILLWERDIK